MSADDAKPNTNPNESPLARKLRLEQETRMRVAVDGLKTLERLLSYDDTARDTCAAAVKLLMDMDDRLNRGETTSHATHEWVKTKTDKWDDYYRAVIMRGFP